MPPILASRGDRVPKTYVPSESKHSAGQRKRTAAPSYLPGQNKKDPTPLRGNCEERELFKQWVGHDRGRQKEKGKKRISPFYFYLLLLPYVWELTTSRCLPSQCRSPLLVALRRRGSP